MIEFIIITMFTGLMCYGCYYCYGSNILNYLLKYSLISVNWIVDLYLTQKYKHESIPHINECVYGTDQITIKHLSNGQSVTMEFKHDLNRDNPIIDCDYLMSANHQMVFDESTIIYLHYHYDNEHFIFPCKYKPALIINLPLYQRVDIESCVRMKYTDVCTSVLNDTTLMLNGTTLTDIINEYAGPKGTFYTDIGFEFTPNFIILDDGKKLMSNDQDVLHFVDIIGNDMKFDANEKINVCW